MPLDIFLLVIIACYTAAIVIAMRYMYKAMKMVREAEEKARRYQCEMLERDKEEISAINNIKDFVTKFNERNYGIKLEWSDFFQWLYIVENNDEKEE